MTCENILGCPGINTDAKFTLYFMDGTAWAACTDCAIEHCEDAGIDCIVDYHPGDLLTSCGPLVQA